MKKSLSIYPTVLLRCAIVCSVKYSKDFIRRKMCWKRKEQKILRMIQLIYREFNLILGIKPISFYILSL